MKKSLIFWLVVSVCTAWILVGCEQEAKTEYVTQKEMIHLDVFAADETDLREALVKTGNLSIGLSDVTLTDDLTIPAGKLVYILDSTGGLDPSSSKLTVEGQVYVGVGGTLKATSSGVVAVTTGTVHVVKGGTLDIDVADSVNDGAAAPATVLGTAKVGFASETTLKLSGSLTNAAALTTALGYVGTGGTLYATVTGSKPSDFQALNLGGKKLITTALANETLTSALTVPAGLTLTAKADDTLATITGLTVNGTFTTDNGTLAGLTGTAGSAVLTVAQGANATFTAATFATGTVGDIVINGEATFGAAAVPGGDVKVGATGTLTVTGSLTVTGTNTIVVGGATDKVTLTKAAIAGATLTGADGTVTLPDTKTLVLDDTGTIVVAGTGSVALPNSEFGAGTYTATGEVTITAKSAGDTIATAATDTTHKLAVGVLLLGEASTASTNAATYTLVKSNAGGKVLLDAANGKITLPADTGTTKGASLAATQYCGITLGTGSIELGRKTSGAGAGKLALASGATIGTFTETTNYKITDAANLADEDDSAAEAVTLGSGNSGGTITAAQVDVYGANGSADYAVINKDTVFSA